MHPNIEQLAALNPNMTKGQLKGLAKLIEEVVPESQEVLATHLGGLHYFVLTPTTLYGSHLTKIVSIKLNAVTAVNQKALKTIIETSTEKLEIPAGRTKWLTMDTKGLTSFTKTIREAIDS